MLPALKRGKATSRVQVRRASGTWHGAALFSSSWRSPITRSGLVGALTILTLVHAAPAQGPDPQQLFQEASKAQQRGDAALAVRKYEELIRLHPEIIAARANLGIVLVSLGRYDEAIVQYRAALAEVPGNPDLRLNLALAYYKKGDLAGAAGQFISLHEDEPGNVRIATLLGQCYVGQGRDDDAISLLTPFERAQADNLDLEWALGSALIRAGRTEDGVARVEKVAEQGHSAPAYALAAQTYLKLGILDKARRNFDGALRLDAKLPGLYTLGGMIMEYSGDAQGAVGAYQKALEADPDDFEARLRLGGVLYDQRQLEAAKQNLDRALALDPTSRVARYELARVEGARGQLDVAVRELERIVRADPDWLPPHIELVALYYRLKRPEDGAREKKIVDRLRGEEQQRRSKSHVIAPIPPSA
jgi:tetratricopeptide (TPR) repeat protein